MDTSIWIAVGSLATAVIVFINLFLIFIKPRLEKPEFAVEFEMCEPFCRETNMYWIRVRVKNSGRGVARRCIGKIIEVTDSDGKVIDNFDPTQLHWVGTHWHAIPFLSIDLNREDYEYLDLAATRKGDGELYICGDQFLLTKYEPRGIRSTLGPGNYIMFISIYGDNVDPETKYMSLIWGGQHLKDISIEMHDNFTKAQACLKSKTLIQSKNK